MCRRQIVGVSCRSSTVGQEAIRWLRQFGGNYVSRCTTNVRRSPGIYSFLTVFFGFKAGMDLMIFKRAPEAMVHYQFLFFLLFALFGAYFLARAIRESQAGGDRLT